MNIPNETVKKVKDQIAHNKIILYMKGTPEQPLCGFSARAAQTLKGYNVDFAFVDVLANPDIRQALPHIANWPTFPQLYIQGELIGGSDIIVELHQTGELQQLITNATKE